LVVIDADRSNDGERAEKVPGPSRSKKIAGTGTFLWSTFGLCGRHDL